LNAWEDNLPIFDLCLRETLRIYINITALRRNLHDDIRIGDKVIEKGAFVVYSFADAHLNSNIYSNPEKFDPGRFMARTEDVNSRKIYPYLAWGAGEPSL
jgi:cytochrome P450